jgi:hypothetical protein
MSTLNSGKGGLAGVPGSLAEHRPMPMSIDRSDSTVTHETTSNVKVRKYFPETWLWNSTIVGYRL